MHQAAQAYSKTARATVTPRQLEAGLLLKAAHKLQHVKENWDSHNSTLHDALYYNRKLWTVLVTSVTRPENPLSQPIKQNIANLGMFIFDRTIAVQINPDPQKLDILISINKDIAAGLSATPAGSEQTPSKAQTPQPTEAQA